MAFVSPVKHLEALPDTCYHMVLAHLVRKHEQYADFYSVSGRVGRGWEPKIMGTGKPHFTILDNGAAEDHLLSSIELIEVARLVQPNVLVVPDDMDSGPNTVEMAIEFLKSDVVRNYINDATITPQFMVVPHGHKHVQWRECLQDLLTIASYLWVGIAKKHSIAGAGSHTTGRLDLVRDVLNILGNDTKVHLLGSVLNPIELLAISRMPFLRDAVQGVDTALPWVLAWNSIVMGRAGLLWRGVGPNWHSDEEREYTWQQEAMAQANAAVILSYTRDRMGR